MAVEHIFFDLDNTLWDFRKNSEITLRKMYQRENVAEIYHVSFDDFYKEYYKVNENLWVLFRDNLVNKDQLRAQRFPEAFRLVGIKNQELADFFEDNYLDEVITENHLVDNAIETLDYLSKKYTLHIVSNGFNEVTHNKVKTSALNGKFATITSAEEINVRKPEPEIFYHALQKANAKVENSAFVGDDWIADVLGAQAVGFSKNVFYNALNENHYLEGIFIIKNLKELQHIF